MVILNITFHNLKSKFIVCRKVGWWVCVRVCVCVSTELPNLLLEHVKWQRTGSKNQNGRLTEVYDAIQRF